MTSLSETLTAQIASFILTEGMIKGDRLTERRLAEQYRVSRTPIRAAMRQLEEAGALCVTERSGYQIADLAALAPFTEIVEVDAEEAIYLQIAKDRLEGKLPDKITESEMARRYDLSKGRLSRLLNRMSQEGWLARLPGHGWEFLPVLTSIEAYRDSYRFRQLIEPAALLEPKFEVNRPVLENRLEQQTWLVEGGIWRASEAQLFELNSGMHESLIECSQNIFFIDALQRIDRLRRLIDYRQMLDRPTAQARCREHIQLLELVLAGRIQEASTLMHIHLARLGPLKSKLLKESD